MIVNYNYERFLGEAIESVLAQTYQNFEIVICDDGSQDGSREVISGYAEKDARIKPIFQENGGVGSALNSTYGGSSGEIIAMLDADDLFTPTKLECVVEKFRQNTRVGTVLNALTKVDTTGRIVGKIPQFGSLDRGELRERVLRSSAHWSVAPTSGVTFRRACAEQVFPIPAEKFRTEVDGYMCTIAPLFYAVEAIDEPLTIYRVHSSNLTAPTSMDVKFCQKIMSAGERVFSVLAETAQEHGWPITRLENNPTYCEMRLLRDYLSGEGGEARQRNLRDLRAAVAQIETADRRKTRAKANLLSAITLLPLALGRKLLDLIYLPNPLKKFGSRIAPLRQAT